MLNFNIMHKHNEIKRRSYAHFDTSNFLNDLNVELSNFTFDNNCDIESLWVSWKSIFLDVCNRHAPVKYFRVKHDSHPWVDNDIIQLIKEPDKLLEMLP